MNKTVDKIEMIAEIGCVFNELRILSIIIVRLVDVSLQTSERTDRTIESFVNRGRT
jgi:hypothetical protein